MMQLRPLGRTGLSVSPVTIGTARMTDGDADPAEIAAMIARAVDHGVTALEIDAADVATATLLGDILRRAGVADRVHVLARVSSLVRFDLPSPHVHADQAYPGHHIVAETDRLLRALGVERLAVQQLHAWCPEWLGEGDWHAALTHLRTAGKIAGIGVSLFDHDVDAALDIVADDAVDTVQVMHNIFDPGAAARLLPLCAERGVGVIARSPLYFGALAALPATFRPDDWRAPYFDAAHRRETTARIAALARAVGPDVATSALALRFAADHPAIATTAIGMRTRAHLDAALAATALGPLDADLRAVLAQHRWLSS